MTPNRNVQAPKTHTRTVTAAPVCQPGGAAHMPTMPTRGARQAGRRVSSGLARALSSGRTHHAPSHRCGERGRASLSPWSSRVGQTDVWAHGRMQIWGGGPCCYLFGGYTTQNSLGVGLCAPPGVATPHRGRKGWLRASGLWGGRRLTSQHGHSSSHV